MRQLSICFAFLDMFLWTLLQPRTVLELHGLGSAPFDRLYSGYRCFFLFLRVLRCFSSPRSPHVYMVTGLQPAGLPHSDIPGSRAICASPGLFAAYHVLLRLPVPRHPPCALFCLTISTYSVMSDGLFNLSIALVCFCYSLKNNRFDVLIFHQFIFSMQFSRNIFRRCMIYNLLR